MKNVYLVEDYSNVKGDTVRTLVGIYSTLEKAQEAYEEALSNIRKVFPIKDTWYECENTQSTDVYFELMDNTDTPEYHYQLQLTREELK